jgi:hypothetical protein
MSRPIRWSATVVVLLCLAAGAAHALPLAQTRPEVAAPIFASWLEAAWEWLASRIWPAEAKPADQASPSVLQKDGGCADPWGRPIPCGG